MGSTREIASDPRRRGQHIGSLLAISLALIAGFGCKRSERVEPPVASAAASVPTAPKSLPDEVYDDEIGEPAASASADGSTRVRRHAPAVSKRRTDPTSAARLFDDYGFPVLAAIEHLCGRRDYPPGGGELTWDAFAADATPSELVDRYKKRLGEAGFQRRAEGAIWTIPADAANPRTLEVLPLAAQGRHKSCAAQPGPGAKSVIVISRR